MIFRLGYEHIISEVTETNVHLTITFVESCNDDDIGVRTKDIRVNLLGVGYMSKPTTG